MSLVAVGRDRQVRAAPSGSASLSLIWRFAMRELRAGLAGFWVFIACIALGVAVITGVGALTGALLNGFAAQGRVLLGGDVTLRRVHRKATDAERAEIARLGEVSETATMRSMARLVNGDDQTLVEVKAIDEAYPLLGSVDLARGGTIDDAVRKAGGAVVAQSLLDRLGLAVGDTFKLGTSPIKITGVLRHEPDKIAARLSFGPRVMVSHETLAGTGLVQPGTLISWRYAILAPDGDTAPIETVERLRGEIKSRLDEGGFIVRDRRDPSPSITRLLNRLRDFLTLLGLAALLIGGVGVANAVGSYVDRKRKVIATYKSVGASSRMVLGIYLCQVLIIAALGTVIGVLVGSLVPPLISFTYGGSLPIPLGQSFSWGNVLTGLVYGLLVTLLFVLWPLGQAERIRPAALFRDEVGGNTRLPGWHIMAAVVAIGLALTGFAVWVTESAFLAAGFVAGMFVIMAVFLGLGQAVTWLAGRLPRPRRPELALAMTGLGAPGGLTLSVVLSLGAGLSLLVAVSLVDNSLVAELRGRLPENAPHYFAVDIAKGDRATFEGEIEKLAPGTEIETAPMLRGRIVKLNGVEASEAEIDPQAKWVLNGDRGITYATEVPKGSKIVAGTWWPSDVEGEPQVSFVADLAEEMNLKVGDTMTVNILGRNVTARITSLRQIEWESLSINFTMVFSPNTLRGAPHNLLATVRFKDGAPPEVQAAAARRIGQVLPNVSMINVRDAIEAFARVFGRVMTAVRVAAGITLMAGALVLAGALATAQRRRMLQAVVLKCIGATRAKLLAAHLAEYGLLALVTAIIALGVGTVASWVVCREVLELDLLFSLDAVAGALGVCILLVVVFGLVGTWRVLAARPVPILRGM